MAAPVLQLVVTMATTSEPVLVALATPITMVEPKSEVLLVTKAKEPLMEKGRVGAARLVELTKVCGLSPSCTCANNRMLRELRCNGSCMPSEHWAWWWMTIRVPLSVRLLLQKLGTERSSRAVDA